MKLGNGLKTWCYCDFDAHLDVQIYSNLILSGRLMVGTKTAPTILTLCVQVFNPPHRLDICYLSKVQLGR